MTITVKYYSSRKFSDLSSALSHKLYGEVRGVSMRWVPLTSCDEYIMAGGVNLASAGYSSHVWCSGYSTSYGKTSRPFRLHSLRGPLSQNRAKSHMNITSPCAGDPLLLISDAYDITDEPLVPCVFTKNDISTDVASRLGHCRRVTINDALETILTAIKNSLYVLTDVYEGLVFADSYHVPSTYVSCGSVPFVVRDYLENFNYNCQSIVDVMPDSLLNFACYNSRDTVSLRSVLIKTLPTI